MANWQDKILEGFTVVTGGGVTFTPRYLIASVNKKIPLNVEEFGFPGVQGSLVERRLNRGRRFDIEIIFQGSDNIDQASAFENAVLANTGAITIYHPIYDTLVVQPLELNFDDKELNCTYVRFPAIETIGSSAIAATISPATTIETKNDNATNAISNGITADVPSFDVNTITAWAANSQLIFQNINSQIKDATDLSDYTNAYNALTELLASALSTPTLIIAQAHVFLSMPSTFNGLNVDQRIAALTGQFNILMGMTLQTLTRIISANQKKAFESQGGFAIGAMCMASIFNYDYPNRQAVLNATTAITSNYDLYLTILDSLQSPTGGQVGNYMPDSTSITALNQLVNYTVSQLNAIAASAKIQVSKVLQFDTCIIKLVHQLYGLDSHDANIDKFISDNYGVNFGLNSFIKPIPKGTTVIYYA